MHDELRCEMGDLWLPFYATLVITTVLISYVFYLQEFQHEVIEDNGDKPPSDTDSLDGNNVPGST